MKFRKLLPVVLLFLSFSVSADPTAPAGDARKAFDMWLSAHNSGRRAQLEAFNAKYQVKADVQNDLEFRDSVGRLQLIEIRTSTPTTVEALLFSDFDKAMLATLAVKNDHGLRLSKMQFESVSTPAALKPKPVLFESLVQQTAQRLGKLARDEKISGSFLLACKGQPVFEWNGGFADREAEVPVSAGTKFRMASLGKMFTAVAILQLAEAGKLSLDEKLSTHLPSYPNQAVASAISLRQLLSHTSGTGDVFGEGFDKISASLKTHEDYWAAFASAPLEFKAGTQDRYSNYGYILLGSVIEATSGQSYYDYVEQHIFAPAGMTSTGAEPESQTVSDRANAYTKVDGKLTRETASLPWRGTAAGGGYTTAHDLLRFATALQNGSLLSAQALQAATEPQNNKHWYGYGFMVGGEGRERQFGHEGGAPGSNAIVNVRPNQGCTVIGLSNFDPSTMANVVNYVTLRLP